MVRGKIIAAFLDEIRRGNIRVRYYFNALKTFVISGDQISTALTR